MDAILAEERDAQNIIEALRRAVIAKMELRNQPLVDQYQDEMIFRLPLDARLVILGALASLAGVPPQGFTASSIPA